MRGKIIKGIAGFYYCITETGELYECKAKGVFRNIGTTPLVGDDVDFEITHEKDKKGNIISVSDRSNSLIRPAVANINLALVVFAISKPEPNLNLLDRFLVNMRMQQIDTVICFNKLDEASDSDVERLKDIYSNCGNTVVFTSIKEKSGIDTLKDILKSKTTVLAGPSGVGKSSMMNCLCPQAGMVIGTLSSKIERGKQTTRHTELIRIEENTYLCDTPGFSSLYVDTLEKDELKYYFPEFEAAQEECRFRGCNHIKEPDCVVKNMVNSGLISRVRYDNYLQLYGELADKNKYK